jgi:hypothetical protein
LSAPSLPAALDDALIRLLPDAEQTLLLRACLETGPGGEQAWGEWRAAHPDPAEGLRTDLAGEATSFTPMLHRALQAAGIDPADEEFAAALAAAGLREERRAAKLHAGAAAALAALHEGAIDAIVLRGVPLAELAYPDRGLRHTYDLDLLLDSAEQGRAAALLSERGGDAPERPTGRGDLIARHPLGVPVSMHETLCSVRGPQIPVAAVGARCRRLSFAGGNWRVLSADDELLHMFAQSIAGTHPASLRWVPDAWYLLGSEDGPDWERLVATAAESQLAVVSLGALRYLAGLGLAVPDSALQALRERAVSCGRAEADFVVLAALRAQRRRRRPIGAAALPRTSLAVARRLPVALADRARGRGPVPR